MKLSINQDIKGIALPRRKDSFERETTPTPSQVPEDIERIPDSAFKNEKNMDEN